MSGNRILLIVAGGEYPLRIPKERSPPCSFKTASTGCLTVWTAVLSRIAAQRVVGTPSDKTWKRKETVHEP
jgi:hypothetical protein